MSKPHVCPLCGGSGKLPGDQNVTAPTEKTCHACGGRGIVWSPDDDQPQPAVIPYPVPYTPWYPDWTWRPWVTYTTGTCKTI